MELEDAQFVLKLCREFGCLPSELYREDSELIRLLAIEALGTKREEEGDGFTSDSNGYGA